MQSSLTSTDIVCKTSSAIEFCMGEVLGINQWDFNEEEYLANCGIDVNK